MKMLLPNNTTRNIFTINLENLRGKIFRIPRGKQVFVVRLTYHYGDVGTASGDLEGRSEGVRGGQRVGQESLDRRKTEVVGLAEVGGQEA